MNYVYSCWMVILDRNVPWLTNLPWHTFLETPETFQAYFGAIISVSYLKNRDVSKHEIMQQICPFRISKSE